jgi:hypothetical protein
MTLYTFMTNQPLTVASAIAAIGLTIYGALTLYDRQRPGASVLMLLSVGVVFFLFISLFRESQRLTQTQTIVVMPNRQNIRLGEDLQPSFCLEGMARNFENTNDGIISTTQKMYLGKPMRCLSVEGGIALLRQSGANEKQLEAMRLAYSAQ